MPGVTNMLRPGVRILGIRLPRGVGVLTVLTAMSVLFGFGREAVVAYYFGASAQLDAFLVALSLPRLLVIQVVVLIGGVVLPEYVRLRECGDLPGAERLARSWAWRAGVAYFVACLLLFLAARPLINVLGPGLTEQGAEAAARWFRLLLPYLWMMGTAGAFKTVLDSHRAFVPSTASRIVVTLGVILSCVVFAKTIGVEAMVFGYTIGALAAFVWQMVVVRKFEPRILGLPRAIDRQVRIPLTGIALMLVHAIGAQVRVLIDRAFASTLPSGSVAALNYAEALNGVPASIVTSALATALFPSLAERIARSQRAQAFSLAARWSLFLVGLSVIPIIILFSFRTEIVAFLLERGRFGPDATQMTASVLAVLPLMIPVNGASTLFTRLLIAQGRMEIVAGIAVISVILKVSLNLWLVESYGLVGLAIATVAAASVATALRIIAAWQFTGANPKGGSTAETDRPGLWSRWRMICSRRKAPDSAI